MDSEDSTLSALIINIIDCSQESPQITWEMQNLDENTTIGWRYPRVIHEDISRIVAQLREPDSIDLASQSDDSDDSDSQEDICPSDKVEPHYKAVGQECLPSCGTAGGTHAGGDCQDTENFKISLIGGTYEPPCCTRQVRSRVNGVCDNTQNNGCHAGDLLDTTDSDEDYKWSCLGSGRGVSVNCSKQRPRADGRCDYNSPTPECSVGRLVEQADDDEHEKWICKGIGSGVQMLTVKNKNMEVVMFLELMDAAVVLQSIGDKQMASIDGIVQVRSQHGQVVAEVFLSMKMEDAIIV